MGRSKERHTDTNQEATKAKKKAKSPSTSKKRRKQPQQTGLKPCLKQPNAAPKKRKWSIKFLERVTVYQIEEIVPKQKKSVPAIPPTSDKVIKSVNVSSPVQTECKTRLNIFYERLAR